MFIRAIRPEEREIYNKVVNHPLQSWEWGEFKKKTGLAVERIGVFENSKLTRAVQISFHPVPFLNKNVGYFPKGYMPDITQLESIKDLAIKNNAIFIKMEPNVSEKVGVKSAHKDITKFLLNNGCVPGKPLFTKYTFKLDLTQSEETLFKNLESKTRYNVNLAYKKGVRIYENTTEEGMDQYIQILKETTKRQGFYAHSPEYFKKMWNKLKDSGVIRIFNAVYDDKVLTSWVMFIFNDVIYYPYGSSRSIHRKVMANNLMMWEMIKLGKKEKCHTLDMWGSLGPEPSKLHQWYGFHKFKKGYAGDLVEFLGTYDYVIDFPMYKVFKIMDSVRWKVLKIKAKLKI